MSRYCRCKLWEQDICRSGHTLHLFMSTGAFLRHTQGTGIMIVVIYLLRINHQKHPPELTCTIIKAIVIFRRLVLDAGLVISAKYLF